MATIFNLNPKYLLLIFKESKKIDMEFTLTTKELNLLLSDYSEITGGKEEPYQKENPIKHLIGWMDDNFAEENGIIKPNTEEATIMDKFKSLLT